MATLLLSAHLQAQQTQPIVEEVWAKRFYNSFGSWGQGAKALAVDGSGNVYVTGNSSGGADLDYATVKYDAAGNELWVKTYGKSSSSDQAVAIAVDGSGNVYVTGNSSGGAGSDYATVKYDAAGNELWVSTYDNNGEDDQAVALAVDGSGNVYVTGSTHNFETGSDYATVKYDAAGNQLWASHYHFSLSDNVSHDQATALAVDGLGNVYVTGQSSSYIITVKYDAAGNELWDRDYNNYTSYTHTAVALETDNSGNVYVVATIFKYDPNTDDQGDSDYVTIKYDTSGDNLWERHYDNNGSHDQATALAVDGSGNVYVTGNSYDGADSDYATVMYDAAGNQLWVSTYDNKGSHDQATALAVDGSGNVYVTGQSYGAANTIDYATVKYDAAGNQLWVKRYDYDGSSDQTLTLAMDDSGNVYVTGNSSNDYATVKYNAAGNQLWVKRYKYDSSSNQAKALAVDGSGNVYVTGSSNSDYVTVKYDAAGNQLWVRRYNNNFSYDSPAGLAVDNSGNVYVTGSSNSDYATVKYDAAGNQLWVKTYNNGDTDQAIDLAVDGSGNVYVTGQSYGNSPYGLTYDFATVKYDASGNELWVKRYDFDGYDESPVAMAVDGSGNVYVTGYGFENVGSNIQTIKYDAAGNEIWINFYNGAVEDSNFDSPAALAVDGAGNVYITGTSTTATGSDYATVKYDAAGNQLWVKTYTNGSNDEARAFDLAVDGTGNVYVTGKSRGDTGSDYATVKYDASGDELWVIRYDHGSDDHAAALAMDGTGNVYVTGQSSSATGSDYATVKYDAAGNQLWVKRYDNNSSFDSPTALAVDDSDNVYVTGNSEGDYLTVKYTLQEANQPPVITAIDAQQVDEETKLSFEVIAADDASQILTYSLQGTVPQGAAINATTGAFEWTPTEAQGPSQYTLTIRVTDNGEGNLYAEQDVAILVKEINSEPTLSGVPEAIVTLTEGQAYSFTASATDPDLPVHTLTYSLVNAPAGATIDGATGMFSWTPATAGNYTIDVKVTDNGTPVLSDQKSFGVQVSVVYQIPLITAFSPTKGSIGTTVTITGNNFVIGDTEVTFNGTAAEIVSTTATQIVTTVPVGATTGAIKVTTPGGTATSSTAFTVTYPKPAITSFTPTSGPVGTTVTITGSNLLGVTGVTFNGTAAEITTSTATLIETIVPEGATTGLIRVTTPGGTVTSKTSFTVTYPRPAITSFTPASGPVGTNVTITGSNFLIGNTTVRFNNTAATSVTVSSATTLIAVVPQKAVSGKISITTPGGTATSQTNFTVIVTPAPAVSSFTPASGPVGTSVTITGSNFTNASAVRFGGISATQFTVNSSSQIVATVPAGAISGRISVTTPGGTASSKKNFTVTATSARLAALEEEQIQVSLYPNPVNDKLTIDLKGMSTAGAKTILTDALGKSVMQNGHKVVGESLLELDMSGLRAGLYIFELTIGSTYKVVKVLKQ